MVYSHYHPLVPIEWHGHPKSCSQKRLSNFLSMVILWKNNIQIIRNKNLFKRHKNASLNVWPSYLEIHPLPREGFTYCASSLDTPIKNGSFSVFEKCLASPWILGECTLCIHSLTFLKNIYICINLKQILHYTCASVSEQGPWG